LHRRQARTSAPIASSESVMGSGQSTGLGAALPGARRN
jgi:hypothetical protein